MAPKPDLKAEGTELGKIIADGRKKPLSFAMLIGAGGLVVRADKIKSPEMMRKLAKSDGGGTKGCWGKLSVNQKILVLDVESEPPGSFEKAARKHFSERGHSVRFEIRLPFEDVPEPQAAPPKEKPVKADDAPQVEEDPGDEDDVAAENGDLSALIKAARKKPYNFACMVADEGVMLVGHRRKAPGVLVKQAKSAGASAKGGWGTLAVEGKYVVLNCLEDPPGTLARKTKIHLKTQGLKFGVIIRSPAGESVEQEEDVVESASAEVGDTPESSEPRKSIEEGIADEAAAKKARDTEIVTTALAKFQENLLPLKKLLGKEEKVFIANLRKKLLDASLNGDTGMVDHIIFAMQARAAGDPYFLAQFKTAQEINDADNKAILQAEVGNVSKERLAELENWIDANYMSEEFGPGLSPQGTARIWDEKGGERLAAALKGNSDLGELDKETIDYLLNRVMWKWLRSPDTGESGAEENIEDFTAAMKDDPKFSGQIADVYWNTFSRNQVFAAGRDGSGLEKRDLSLVMMENTIDLNPDGVAVTLAESIGAKEMAEWVMGNRKKQPPADGAPMALYDLRNPMLEAPSEERKLALLKSVTDGALSVQDGDQFASYVFNASKKDDVESKEAQETWAHTLSSVVGRNNALEDKEIDKTRVRVKRVLATEGGRELLFSENMPGPMRNWAVNQLSISPDDWDREPWRPDQLTEGWESEVVGLAFAKKSLDAAEKQFADPMSFDPKAQKGLMANAIGQSFGMPPKIELKPGETQEQFEDRFQKGMNEACYDTDKAPFKNLFDTLAEQKIDPAQMTPIPVTFMSNELGMSVFKVMRLETPNGPKFYDHRGNEFRDAAHWEKENELPAGKVTYPKDLVLGNPPVCKKTPRNPLEDFFWTALDVTAMVAGTVAGVAAIVGTGGAAAPVVIGLAAAYGAGRAGKGLYDKHDLGHDVTDLGDDEIRGLWLDAGSSVLSLGAVGGAARGARLLQQGSKMSHIGATAVATMTHAGSAVDAVSTANSVYVLQQNWSKMTPAQQDKALLTLALQQGMGMAMKKASGGKFADNFDFKRTRNQIEFGTPYKVSKAKGDGDLIDGQVAVNYDPGPPPTGFNIVYKGDTFPSPDKIKLHTQAAGVMEASVKMQSKYKDMIGAGGLDKDGMAQAGTPAWEAQMELKKFEIEGGDILGKLNKGNLSDDEKVQLEARLDELNMASLAEAERFDAWIQKAGSYDDAKKLVAAPSTGAEQAKKQGWTMTAAEQKDYIWVATPSGRPVARRRKAGGTERKMYDVAQGKLVKWEPQEMVVIGHGENKVNFRVSGGAGTGQPKVKEAFATLRRHHSKATRTSPELSAQDKIRARGVSGDDAGHIIGHRFDLGHGMDNMFAQQSNFNRGAYKKMENQFANWISNGAEVHVEVKVSEYVTGRNGLDRAQKVEVSYQIIDPATGKEVIPTRKVLFNNDGNQQFQPSVTREQMEALTKNMKKSEIIE